VLVLTRDPVADRISAVVVAACTRTIRGLMSELPLGPDDGMPSPCVASFDNLHALPRSMFRRRITRLSVDKMAEACRVLRLATDCWSS
jgi:mRNA interferase MazF